MRFSCHDWRPPPARPSMTVLVLWTAILCLATTVHARSPHPPPLRRIHVPSTQPIEIVPRQKSSALAYRSRAPYPDPATLRHSDSFFLTLDLGSILSEPTSLFLKPTEHLIHPNAKVTYADGTSIPLREHDWRLYTGNVVSPRWKDRLWSEESAGLSDGETQRKASIGSATIMVHDPGSMETEPLYEGVFTIDGEHYNILTKEHYDRVKTDNDIEAEHLGRMVVFRTQDSWHDDDDRWHSQKTSTLCNHDRLPFNTDSLHPVRSGISPNDPFALFKRDDTGGMSGSSNYINSIGNPEGCPSTQQVVYMGVALDCNYIRTYGSEEAARTQALNNWNQISSLYRSTFNISLGIVELVVQNQTCPATAPADAQWNVACNNNLTLDSRLSLFSQWRGNRGDDGVGLWHLLSACPTDTEVGVAWLGTLCQTTANQQGSSYVSGTGISTATKTEWSLIAHEIGHGFGAIHDCTSGCSLSGSCCPYSTSACDAGGKFIMNPTTSTTEQTFSPCTLGNICSGLGQRLVSSSCIQDPGSKTTISTQQCGNGIVEPGEECDPGFNNTSPCCDASTCKFKVGAVCDPSNSVCCSTECQYASAGTVCRAAVDATCDIAETCTGNNATCPEDKTAADGTSCGSNGLACASGTCTSLNLQCQTAGRSLNLTQACGQRDDQSCVVSCRDPSSQRQCIILQTPLVDGSPCGYGGHCYNGTCNAGKWQDTAASWYRQNLQISIPVTIVAGILILGTLFAILRCVFGSCTRRSAPAAAIGANRRSMRQSTVGGGPASRDNPSWASNEPFTAGLPPPPLPPPPPPPPPPLTPSGNRMSRSGWVDDALYNGQDHNAAFRPNVYGGGGYGQLDGQQYGRQQYGQQSRP